jgi:shikimate kinase
MSSNINLLTNADSNLILTGYTGPSQPAIGRKLSETLARRLVNFEAQLEDRIGMPVKEVRETYGQARLRNLENDLLEEVLLYRGAVIRISGVTLSYGDNLARLAVTGPVICLVARLDAVLRRLHLSMGARYHDPNERDLALGNLRAAWGARGKPGVYEVDATYLTEAETVQAVASVWQDLTLQRG